MSEPLISSRLGLRFLTYWTWRFSEEAPCQRRLGRGRIPPWLNLAHCVPIMTLYVDRPFLCSGFPSHKRSDFRCHDFITNHT